MTTIYEQLATSVLSNAANVKTMHKKVNAVGLIAAQSKKVLDGVSANITDSGEKLTELLTEQKQLQEHTESVQTSVHDVNDNVNVVHEELLKVADSVSQYVDSVDANHTEVLSHINSINETATNNTKRLVNNLSDLKKSLKDVNYSEQLGELGSVLTSLTTKLDDFVLHANQSFERRDQQMDRVEQTALEAKNAVASFTTILSNFEDRIGTLTEQIEIFDYKLEDVASENEKEESIEDLTEFFLNQAETENTEDVETEETVETEEVDETIETEKVEEPVETDESHVIIAGKPGTKKRFWGFGKKN